MGKRSSYPEGIHFPEFLEMYHRKRLDSLKFNFQAFSMQKAVLYIGFFIFFRMFQKSLFLYPPRFIILSILLFKLGGGREKGGRDGVSLFFISGIWLALNFKCNNKDFNEVVFLYFPSRPSLIAEVTLRTS